MKLRAELSELLRDRLAWVTTTISVSLPVIASLLLALKGEPGILLISIYIFFLLFIVINSIYILIAQKKQTSFFISREISPERVKDGKYDEKFTPKYPLLHPYAKVSLIISGLVTTLVLIVYIQQPNPWNTPSIATPTVTIVITPTTSLVSATPTLMPTQTPFASICDEQNKIIDAPIGNRFRRDQGVSLFTAENAPEKAILSNTVRAIVIDPRGLWIGYYATKDKQSAGLGFFDKKNWLNCNFAEGVNGNNINDIAIDSQGKIWVALERKGVAFYDGNNWKLFTKLDGLPSEDVFHITIDTNNSVWVGTWEGVAKFDGTRWSTPYTAENGTLLNNHVFKIAFDGQGDIWLGHINHGISLFKNDEGKWLYLSSDPNSFGGNDIRAIAIQKPNSSGLENVWVGTGDGGVSKYSDGIWTQYHVQNGLPSEDVRDIQIDPLNRVWVATAKGTVYLENDQWKIYDTLDTARVAFGPECANATCPYDSDRVWTATSGLGLTNSRLPKPNMIDVVEVCFFIENQNRTCVTPVAANEPGTIEAKLPTTVLPGQKIRFEIVVSPRFPYQLREDRGDLLAFTEESDANLFGAYLHIAVKGVVDSGQKYTFTDYDNPLVAPKIESNEQEFISRWRIWLFTRYTDPIIWIKFTVKR